MDETQRGYRDDCLSTEKRDSEADRQQCPSYMGQYWRSLEELAGTEEFHHYLKQEFPEQADTWYDDRSRREFLKLMGASLALAGVYGCSRQPADKIVPYVRQPEQIVPGKPLYYATAMELHGSAIGLLVETHEGRPTKVEGNPQHPAVPAAQWGGGQQFCLDGRCFDTGYSPEATDSADGTTPPIVATRSLSVLFW